MTPAAPSPHRFVTPGQRQASPIKRSKEPSTPQQHVQKEQLRKPPAPQQASIPGSQFAATPRFAKPKRLAVRDRSPSPPRVDLSRALAQSVRQRREDVEDIPSSPAVEDEEMLDGEQAAALPTTENRSGDATAWELDQANSSKRRKVDHLSPDELQQSALSPVERTPEQTALAPPKAIRQSAQFRDPYAATSTVRSAQQRPVFLQPSGAAQEMSQPLPEAFSPHRRGQKFVPGGMAAMVQQWVIEAGQAAPQARKQRAFLDGDLVMKVRVVEVLGEGTYTAKAKTVDDRSIHVLLARSSPETACGIGQMHVSSIVGIRPPSWEVEIQGRSWLVGVDWRVLT